MRAVLEVFVAGIDVDGDDRKTDRGALAQHVQNLDEGPAVFPAGQPHHHAVPVFNQVEVVDRLGDFPRESRFKGRRVTHCLVSSRGPTPATCHLALGSFAIALGAKSPHLATQCDGCVV